jgi:hypothetical protein
MSSSAEHTNESDPESAPPSRQELTELIRAIKFANPDLSQREVHQEITEKLAESVGCLKDVELQDVKKVWKKAVVAVAQGGDSSTTGGSDGAEQPLHDNDNGNDDIADASDSPNADLAEKLRGITPEVFTVGDGSKVYEQLAKDYTAAHVAMQVAKEQEAASEDAKNYVHAFLDVPANKSGERPHQALINFQTNKSGKSSSSPSSKSAGGDQSKVVAMVDGKVIVKIQRAAPLSPEDTAQHPMLLYDQSRTLKTFVHPDPDDDGYEKLATMIAEKGMGGALGQAGGTKAYFYARLTKRKKGTNILSIEITEVALPQSW